MTLADMVALHREMTEDYHSGCRTVAFLKTAWWCLVLLLVMYVLAGLLSQDPSVYSRELPGAPFHP